MSAMPPLLDCRLADLRRRVRQSLYAYGLSWLAGVVVALILASCLGDWLFHFDDAGVRVILGLAILAAGTWVAIRYLITPLRVPLSDVDLALRIEDRYPGFQDSLASTVQFLAAREDPRLGSPSLQRAVARQTVSRLGEVDCGDVLQTREVRRIAALALGICLTALVIAGLGRTQTFIALHRLFLPFSAPAWPRQTNLRLLDGDLVPLEAGNEPLTVVRGEIVKLFAENETGRLPERVLLEFLGDDGKVSSEAMRPMTITGSDGTSRELAVGQLPATQGEFQFRAVGGDDRSMGWRRMRVIPPPAIESLRVTLNPPRYSNRPVEQLPDGVGHLQGLVGTRVDVTALAVKPLQSASLRVHDREETVPIAPDGRHLTASFLIVEPGIYSWWFELKDTEGFENAEPLRYDVRAQPDIEPEIRLDLPASDLQVTTDAEVPLRTVARDDLGLKEIRLVHHAEAEAAEQGKTTVLSGGESRPREQSVDYVWRLAELDLSEGTRIAFHTEATDDFDLADVFPAGKTPPAHVGRSVSRLLIVVSKEDKVQELAQRQAGLLDELERTFQQQKRAREQVGDLQTQLENAGKFRAEDLDTLQRTELGQRDVAGQLTHERTGLARRARDLLDELRGNHVDDGTSERRLTALAEELGRLGDENLPAIEQALTQARKQLQNEKDRGPATPPADPARPEKSNSPETALREAADHQDAVLDSMGELLQELSQWRNEHDAARELADLIRQQAELNQKTGELGRQTLTRPRDQLEPQQQADLAKLVERQKKQSQQLDQIQSRMQERIEDLSGSNSDAAADLKEAAGQARDQGISEQMREAAGAISENRMGEAARTQEQILEKLREVENSLNGSTQSDTETLVKKLRQSEDDLAALRDREQELMRKLDEAAKQPDPAGRQAELQRLRKEQQQLREDTAKMARRLQRLQAHRTSATAHRAAERMQAAQEDLDQGNEEAAAQEQQEALDDLEQAQRELARQRRRAEEQLAQEQLEKIATELASLIDREQAVLDETQRLDALRQAAGKLNRSQLLALRNLTAGQRSLLEDTNRLVETLSAAEVFAQALRGAARGMQRAIDLLEERQTGQLAQQAERNALRRFTDLNDALKDDEQNAAGSKPPDGKQQEGDGGGNQGPPTDGIPAIAQLKLLLSLQREILERTTQFQKLRQSGTPFTDEQKKEFEQLTDEQEQLADLARNLSNLAGESADDEAPADKPADKPADGSADGPPDGKANPSQPDQKREESR